MKKRKKKLRLKKQAYIFLGIIVLVVVLIVVGLNVYQNYLYKQTTEYKLLAIGYTNEEITLLTSKLTDDKISELLNTEKNTTILGLINEKYYIASNLDTYLEYIEEEETDDYQTVVSTCNALANYSWYEVELETDTSLGSLMLVNKFYGLTSDYIPENLVTVSLDYSYGSLGDTQITEEAYNAFLDLWNAASDAGYYLMITSSYRSYEDQEEIYEYRKSTLGERKTDETVARPGHSEHQTGLVIDMTSKTETDAASFTESEAYQWLQENAYKYGWIERYQEDTTEITGYAAESWHWRYVGIEAATVCYEDNITFDEYYAYYIKNT